MSRRSQTGSRPLLQNAERVKKELNSVISFPIPETFFTFNISQNSELELTDGHYHYQYDQKGGALTGRFLEGLGCEPEACSFHAFGWNPEIRDLQSSIVSDETFFSRSICPSCARRRKERKALDLRVAWWVPGVNKFHQSGDLSEEWEPCSRQWLNNLHTLNNEWCDSRRIQDCTIDIEVMV